MKLLLDTNALVDLVAARRPYVEDIRKLCVASTFGDVQLWASTQSFMDAYYVLCRHADAGDVKRAMLASLEFLIPCGTNASDLRRALESEWNDPEDYLIAYSSKHIGADFIITRDADMIDRAPVKAMPANEFLAFMESEHGLVYDELDV